MEALLDRLVTINVLAGTLVSYAAARIYLLPNLDRLRFGALTPPILLLHSLRHLGLMVLTYGTTHPRMPSEFALPAALGDFLAAVLAFVALVAIVRSHSSARAWVWTFNVWGTLDLVGRRRHRHLLTE
jgi:hypothetical protein